MAAKKAARAVVGRSRRSLHRRVLFFLVAVAAAAAGTGALELRNSNNKATLTRRSVLAKAAGIAAAAAGLVAIPFPEDAAVARGPEMDAKSGEQFIPRSECACKTALKRDATEADKSRRRRMASSTQAAIQQEVYDIRFVAYLSRFLLNYDPAAKAWFRECSCAMEEGGGFCPDAPPSEDDPEIISNININDRARVRFAEFAESVELGLASFFVSGQEGLDALLRELQQKVDDGEDPNFVEEAFYRKVFHAAEPPPSRADGCTRKRGILNLLALLSARFPDPEQKFQLAILFSLISDPSLQPTEQIGELLEGAAATGRMGSAAATTVDVEDALEDIRSDAIQLLPQSFRPVLCPTRGVYYIPSLPPLDAGGSAPSSPSARYRAVDPLFGGLGSIPVTKGALSLSAGQYSRLALSGAACTVLVRTVLNPLELVKTKTQLGNDAEFTEVVLLPVEKHENAIDGSRGGRKYKAEEETVSRKLRHADMMSQQIDSFSSSHHKESTGAELVTPVDDSPAAKSVGTIEMILGLVKLRGASALFQSADITFLASIVFGSFGYGATELFRRWFAMLVETDSSNTDTSLQLEATLLAAAAFACIAMCAAATPFEVLRVRSMASIEPKRLPQVLLEFVQEKRAMSQARTATSEVDSSTAISTESLTIRDIRLEELSRLWDAFPKVVSRELPFAIVKFIAFDMAAGAIISLIDAHTSLGGQVQVGSGAAGLAVSAVAGAVAGIAGAIVSHPADLILTLTSSSATQEGEDGVNAAGVVTNTTDWLPIVQDLISRDGGVANLFVGLPTRALFFALVIGLQFWLYDYVKNLLEVGSDDLTLVLDVFYALGKNLIESSS